MTMRALLCLVVVSTPLCAAVRPFTVADEIGIAQFVRDFREPESVKFSQDGNYFAAYVERGRLDVNMVEGELRIYRSADARAFLRGARDSAPPAPWWTIKRQASESPAIDGWRWLKGSSGIAFLEQGPAGSNRLMLATVREKTVAPLTPAGPSVKAFDVNDAEHYAYVLASKGLVERAQAERHAAGVTVTGRWLGDIIFPPDLYPLMAQTNRGELWAVVDGRTVQVRNKDGTALGLFLEGELNFALSPDGRSLITALAFAEIPVAWETRYPPPFPSDFLRLRAGKQDLQAFFGGYPDLASEYVRIDLRTSEIERLTGAPTAVDAGWHAAGGSPQWSKDGEAMLLPATFLDADTHSPARACGALYIDVHSKRSSCVEWLRPEEDVSNNIRITDLRFEHGDKYHVIVSFEPPGGDRGSTEYRQNSKGRWRIQKQAAVEERLSASANLEVGVKQDLNDPPVLLVSESKGRRSRVLWDPNPQLKDIALGKAVVYAWKDATGRAWKAGLYEPPDFKAGRRYPLVIQTHGFAEHEFRPSGLYPTAMAARALASAGLLVLQVGEICPLANIDEASCAVSGYEAAVQQLEGDALVDSDRIGIIGFSRTCYWVMQLLTTSPLRIRAASITDGVMGDYFQYLQGACSTCDLIISDVDATMGAEPFGSGLQTWLQRSPLFNIDKVHAALLVVGEGEQSLLTMWGPYAALRLLKKPTELILLHSDEHVLTSPATRLASQGGSVDWFRFWLQEYEDPNPAKVEQYKRWRQLRALQRAKSPNAANPTADSPIPN